MRSPSASIKALIVFVIIIVVLAACYFYLNSRYFTKEQTGTNAPNNTTSAAGVTNRMVSQGFVTGKDVKILEAKSVDPGSTGQTQVFALAYTTSSTKDELFYLYRTLLPQKGYPTYTYSESTSTKAFLIIASSTTNNLTIAIKPEGTSTQMVTVIIGEK